MSIFCFIASFISSSNCIFCIWANFYKRSFSFAIIPSISFYIYAFLFSSNSIISFIALERYSISIVLYLSSSYSFLFALTYSFSNSFYSLSLLSLLSYIFSFLLSYYCTSLSIFNYISRLSYFYKSVSFWLDFISAPYRYPKNYFPFNSRAS